MVDRRGFLTVSGVSVAGVIAAGAGGFVHTLVQSRTGLLAGVPDPQFVELTPFKDELRLPSTLRPERGRLTEVEMVTTQIRWHSQLPSTPMWTYAGEFPGPTVLARKGVPIRIAWSNKLTGTCPVKAVWVGPAGPDQGRLPFNQAGSGAGYVRDEVAALTPWTTVHVHGGHQNALSDGGTDFGVTPGNSQLCEYPNQIPAHLFYHDHAMSVTALNVMSGLVGNYIVHDDGDDQLDLPRGRYEIPLLISDVNFDTDAHGRLTGRLLAKRVMLNNRAARRPAPGTIPPSLAFVGPFTAVNGVVWPRLDVDARAYRFRVVNASLARNYRLVLIDEETRRPVPAAMTLIGTDMGLLGRPVIIDEALNLAPAERADIVIDFAAHPGQRLTLVNTVATMPPGAVVATANIVHPEVMQFRVDTNGVRRTAIPVELARDFRRLTVADVPSDAVERFVITAYDRDGVMPQLWEMQDADATDTPIIQLATANGIRNLRRVATAFEDTTTFFAVPDSWEKWTFLSVAPRGAMISHPMHVHLMTFQVVERRLIDSSGVDFRTGITRGPITIGGPLPILPEESGWKDTVNVTANTMVVVVGRLAPQTGKVVYHCHSLDHEDEGMMRPLVVMPRSVNTIHDMQMAMMQADSRQDMGLGR